MNVTHELTLRPYQAEAIAAVRGRFAERAKSGEPLATALLVMATGSGKTFTALTMAAKTLQREGARVLWVAHRSELLHQPMRTWQAIPQLASAGTAGIVQASQNDCDADLVLASTGTISRDPLCPDSRLRQIYEHGQPSLVVLDEAHHYAADAKGQWSELLDALQKLHQGRLYLLGLTATPERGDRRDLTKLWGNAPAYRFSQHEAIVSGYLVPPRLVEAPVIWSQSTIRALEQEQDEEAIAGQTRELVTHTVTELAPYKHRAPIVFAASVAAAKSISTAMSQQGWQVETVTAATPEPMRAQMLQQFQSGELDALVNVDCLTEGTDLPRCDMVAVARRVNSVVSWQQIIGRGMRLYANKRDCLVLSLIDNPHGLEYAGELLDMRKERQKQQERQQAQNKLRSIALDGACLTVNWLKVHERAYVVDLGKAPKGEKRGDCWVVRARKGDQWRAFRVRRETIYNPYDVQSLMAAPASREVAESFGRSLFIAARGLVDRSALWRSQPASDSQRDAARRAGLVVEGQTKGEYSDALTVGRCRLSWNVLQHAFDRQF